MNITNKLRIKRYALWLYFALNALMFVWWFSEMLGIAPEFIHPPIEEQLAQGSLIASSTGAAAVLAYWWPVFLYSTIAVIAVRATLKTPW